MLNSADDSLDADKKTAPLFHASRRNSLSGNWVFCSQWVYNIQWHTVIKTLTTRLNRHIMSLSLLRFTIYSFFFFMVSSKVSPSRKGSTSSAVTLKLRKKKTKFATKLWKLWSPKIFLKMCSVLQGKSQSGMIMRKPHVNCKHRAVKKFSSSRLVMNSR